MNKKYVLLIIITLMLIMSGIYYYRNKLNLDTNTTQVRPPIVDHFACGDKCPGPQEKYMVKIYEGITDPDECIKIGGKPYSYYGWGKTDVCKVD